MKHIAVILVCLGFVSAACAQGTPHVDATAVADVASVAAGKPFKVGVHFKIETGWHIYWSNPGDSGLPTRVKLDLPQGYTAGPLEFPTPQRIVLPGDIVNFAYTDEVLLTMTVTPPAALTAGGDVAIPMKVTWLVCQDDCLPGSTELSITLAVGEGKASPESKLFEDWAKKLPVAADKSPDVASVNATYSAAEIKADAIPATVEVTWKAAAPADVQLAPEPVAGWEIADIKSETAGTKTTLHFQLKKAGKTAPPEKFSALLLYKNPAGEPVGIRVGFGSADAATKPAK